MTDIIEKTKKILTKYPDPASGKSILEAGCVIALRLDGDVVKFVLEFASAKDAEDFDPLRIQLTNELNNIEGVSDTQIVTSAPTGQSQTPPPDLGVKPERVSRAVGIKRIYAIASGKGGVGKSTVTSNLAVALAAQGKKIGLLDADLYGPSQVMMMGTTGKPSGTNDHIIPTQSHNVKMISIAQMITDGEAVVWRGPMLAKALDQLLNQVEWGNLDALLIDMPPGTGDVQLSLAQKAKLSGAFIVTTPQDIALLDARRAINMFEKLEVPVLGMIENMATHICSNCGQEDHIFGEGGASSEAQNRGIPFLGSLPLSKDVRMAGDSGKPIALAGNGLFADLAARLIAGKLV